MLSAYKRICDELLPNMHLLSPLSLSTPLPLLSSGGVVLVLSRLSVLHSPRRARSHLHNLIHRDRHTMHVLVLVPFARHAAAACLRAYTPVFDGRWTKIWNNCN